MGDLTIDAEAFCRRLKSLYETWEANPDVFAGASALVIPAGASSDEIRYLKSVSLHLWLFGYEIPETVLLICKEKVMMVASNKKCKLLGTLVAPCKEKAGKELVLLSKDKAEDGSEQMKALLAAIKEQDTSDSPKVGTLLKEDPEGKMVQVYNSVFAAAALDRQDCAAGLAEVMAVRDDAEQRHHRKAALLCSQVMKSVVRERVEGVVDQGRSIKHGKLANEASEAIQDPKAKIGLKLNKNSVDIAYDPVVQSGGQFDLKISAQTDPNQVLDTSMIAVSLGARYQSYCATVSRTFFVNATEEKEKKYKALIDAHGKVLAALTDGADLAGVYAAAQDALRAAGCPEMADALTKHIGFGTGIEFKDSRFMLSPKAAGTTARAGMVFNVILGCGPLEDSSVQEGGAGRTYSLLVADTVLVKGEGKPAEALTDFSKRDWGNVAYKIEEGQEEMEVESDDGDGAAIGKDNLRDRGQNENLQMQARQKDIVERKNQETMERLLAAKKELETGPQKQARSSKTIQAFKSLADLVPVMHQMVVQCDARHECLLLPIYGVLVPFHIMTVRSINFSQDLEHAQIRVIFNTPAAHGTEGYDAAVRFKSHVFVKEMNFRSGDPKHAARVVQEAKQLLRHVRARDKERLEKSTLVSQEKLVPMKGKIYRLTDCWIRPTTAGRGRKVPGVLEAHTNGFRYSSPRSEEVVDIMYRNIQHCFLQESEGEHITLLHFHLANPIMVNKKKTSDVQVYVEVMDVVQTLDGGRRNAYDPDEIEEEQREREKRNMTNRQFRAFCKKVMEDIWDKDARLRDKEFDKPYRDLGFHGIHAKSNVLMLPSAHCLVELQEMPFFVCPLDDIELVSLERVEFGSKSFDMVIVFKDFTKPAKAVSSIPTTRLDTVRLWLTQSDTAFYEHRKNIKWSEVLKALIKDPETLIECGGWKGFLGMEDEEDEEEEEEESDFEPTDSEEEESSEEEDSDDYVDSADEEPDSEEEADSDEEAGKTWDELEREAKRQDRERDAIDGEEERAPPKKKKRPPGGGSAGPSKKVKR